VPDTFLRLRDILNTAIAEMTLRYGVRRGQTIGTIALGHDVLAAEENCCHDAYKN